MSERNNNIKRNTTSIHGRRQERRKRKRQIAFRVSLSLFIALLVILIGRCTWKSLAFANTLFESITMIFAGGVILEVFILYLSKSKYWRTLVFVIFIAIVINTIVAKAVLTEIDDNKNKEPVVKTTTKEDIDTNIRREEQQFDWREDLYILNVSDYYAFFENEEECIEELMNGYANQHVKNETPVRIISDEELNGGQYGKYIDEALKYAADYEKCKMKKVKIVALNLELEQRKYANDIYENFSNLKIIGDLYIKLINLEDLTDIEKKDKLEEALKYYIWALPYAHWDSKAEEKDVTEIKEQIVNVYTRLSKESKVDRSHKNRILKIIKIFEKI